MEAMTRSEAPVAAPPGRDSPRSAALALVGLGALGVLLLGGVVVCPSRALLGVPCPGCGLTRATIALLTGDLAGSFSFHPLWPLLLPLVGWVVGRPVLVRLGWLAQDGFDPLRHVPARGWIAFIGVLIGVWLLRLLGHLGGHPDGFHPELGLLGGLLGALRAAMTG